MKRLLFSGLIAISLVASLQSLQAQTTPVKQWDKTFGGSGTDRLYSVHQTTDGGYILGGYSLSVISGDKSQANQGAFSTYDYWVVKLDANGNKIWDKTFGGSDSDYLTCLQQTSDGGYILGGSSESGISGDKSQASRGSWFDYWVVKLDANGNKIWDKTLGGNNDDGLASIQQTSDGGYILGGGSISPISGDKTQADKGGGDYWVVKLDASGNKIWDKTFGGSNSENFRSIQQISDGGFILGGYSGSPISGDKTQASKGGYDYWVVKLDASGNKIWDKTFGGSNEDALTSLQQTLDGGYILGGNSISSISSDKSQACLGGNDYWVVKLDSSGNKTWDKTFGGSDYDNLTSLKQTTDGGYFLGGSSRSPNSGDKSQACLGFDDYWVVKLDVSGNKIWEKTFGGSGLDLLNSLEQTSDGGYILGGTSASGISSDKNQASKGVDDYWIIKLSASVTGFKETVAAFPISIYPNPGNGKFTLQLSNLTVPAVEVTVSDMLGRVALQQELQVSGQQVYQELILPSVKGIYLLQIKAGERISTRKLVVE